MPFIKRYPDGSVFDYENGHRTAETVARQKAEGTYAEPKRGGLPLAAIPIVLLVGLGVAATAAASTENKHQLENKQAIERELETASQGKVLAGSHDDDELLLEVDSSNPGQGSVLKCAVDKFNKETKAYAAVFCSQGGPAELVLPLPHH